MCAIISPRIFLNFFRYSAVFLWGLQSGESHIRPGIRGYLIAAGDLKFGRFAKGGYNPREDNAPPKHRQRANSREFFFNFCYSAVFLRGGGDLGKSIPDLAPGDT